MKDAYKTNLMWWFILLLATLLFFTSCATERIPVERISIVEKYRDSIRYDSIFVHDSAYIYDRGETIYQYKQKTEYRYLFINKTDTVHLTDTIPVLMRVEKELTTWQQMKVDFGGIAIALLMLLLFIIKK